MMRCSLKRLFSKTVPKISPPVIMSPTLTLLDGLNSHCLVWSESRKHGDPFPNSLSQDAAPFPKILSHFPRSCHFSEDPVPFPKILSQWAYQERQHRHHEAQTHHQSFWQCALTVVEYRQKWIQQYRDPTPRKEASQFCALDHQQSDQLQEKQQ